jgi:hypothetical protein
MVEAYKEVVREDRLTVPLELGGVAILAWLFVGERLYRGDRLPSFLRGGKLITSQAKEEQT